jgi:hypothetical protein
MTRLISAAAAVAAAIVLWSGLALAQAPVNCPKPNAPQQVQGKVVSVDPAKGVMVVRSADGSTHEFQASKETLQDMKVGDTIEAKLRPAAPNCK